MEQYTPRERSEIVEIYIQQNKSIMKTQRAFKKLKNVKSALLRTPLSVYTKNFRLEFWNKIIMSDEAHFTLNGTVNMQNCRIYATAN